MKTALGVAAAAILSCSSCRAFHGPAPLQRQSITNRGSRSQPREQKLQQKQPWLQREQELQHQHQQPQYGSRLMATIEAGDADDMPPCPSGVNELPKKTQSLIFAGIFAALGVTTFGTIAFADSVLIPTGLWDPVGAGPYVLGLIFIAAGISHFTLHEDFCRMYPGKGAWGLWYLPGSASFHVNWTGVAEFLGGAGLLLGKLGVAGDIPLMQVSALALFFLTIAVTPANMYMYSHGAQFPKGIEIPVWGHLGRGVLQPLLLAALWCIAN